MIITKISKSITEYAKLGKANVFTDKYGCKNCGYEGRLHRHGFYSRNVITRYTVYRVFILRLKCPSCNKTYSVLPSFLIPYYQYSFDFIFLCLYYSYVAAWQGTTPEVAGWGKRFYLKLKDKFPQTLCKIYIPWTYHQGVCSLWRCILIYRPEIFVRG